MRQNPHVRICGGPGSATTLVYPTVERRRQLGNVVDPGSHLRLNHRIGRRVETERITQILSIIHSAVFPFTRDRSCVLWTTM